MSVLMHYDIIGKNLKEYRRKNRLTQEELAERAGICQQFLSKLERGKGIPSLETVMALCDALDVDVSCILSRSATHDDNPPCRLRDDHSPFSDTLSGALFQSDEPSLIVIRAEDLPFADLELPDTDFDEEHDD